MSREERHKRAVSRLFAYLGGVKAGHRIERQGQLPKGGGTVYYHVDEVYVGWEDSDAELEPDPVRQAEAPRKGRKKFRPRPSPKLDTPPETLPPPEVRRGNWGVPENLTVEEWKAEIAQLIERSDPTGEARRRAGLD